MHVCVIGAGVVGLATAYQLQRAGHRVTVVDQGAPGEGASGGNGAQLSYAYVQPLADAAIWRQLPKLLLSPDSPLKLRPQLDPKQWAWAVSFMAACNQRTSRASTAALLLLANESRQAFDAMRADITPDCDFSNTGKLVLFADNAGVESARRQVALQQTMGSQQSVVSTRECIDIEPALAGYAQHIAGAVHTPGECAADCLKLCRALAETLAQRGVALLRTRAVHLERRGAAVVALQTGLGPVEADMFVLALGSGSHALAQPLGLRLPVYPLKGYSITLDLGSAPAAADAPQVSVTDSTRKVVFARIGSRLRVAGMAELVGYDTAIPAARIDALAAATRAVFPGCTAASKPASAAALHPWTGMRPATPTGVPLIGHLRGAPANLLVNTGHGALGFTLAFGSAARIAAQIGPLA